MCYSGSDEVVFDTDATVSVFDLRFLFSAFVQPHCGGERSLTTNLEKIITLSSRYYFRVKAYPTLLHLYARKQF